MDTDPERPLLEVLRKLGPDGHQVRLRGSPVRRLHRAADNRPVLSCIMPVGSAQDRKIVTIEGLSDGVTLHPVQQAFIEETACSRYARPGW